MNDLVKRILLRLPDYGAFKLGAFRLVSDEISAPLSPYYVNLRNVRSYPGILQRIVEAIQSEVQGIAFDLIADVPTAATPLVAVMSVNNDWPMVSPRLDKKDYGSGSKVDGVFNLGQTVLLIDDLVTTAESKFSAISVLEESGLVVKDVAVFLDRQQGGREELAKAGYRLHAVTTLQEFVQVLHEAGRISNDAEELISMYQQGNLRPLWELTEGLEGAWTQIK